MSAEVLTEADSPAHKATAGAQFCGLALLRAELAQNSAYRLLVAAVFGQPLLFNGNNVRIEKDSWKGILS